MGGGRGFVAAGLAGLLFARRRTGLRCGFAAALVFVVDVAFGFAKVHQLSAGGAMPDPLFRTLVDGFAAFRFAALRAFHGSCLPSKTFFKNLYFFLTQTHDFAIFNTSEATSLMEIENGSHRIRNQRTDMLDRKPYGSR
jgi:hypothetical protein